MNAAKILTRPKPPPLPPPDGYLTIREAGVVLRLKERKVSYLIAHKKLRSAKIDGRRLLRRADLDAYVMANMSDNPEVKS